jgi:hypothetical protein
MEIGFFGKLVVKMKQTTESILSEQGAGIAQSV